MRSLILTLLVTAAASCAAEAAQRLDTPASPFAGLYRLDGVSTSNDEYGIWLFWTARSYKVQLPGLRPTRWESGDDVELLADIAVSCRADGRETGHLGPQPIRALLRLPLHPDIPDVPGFFDPRYWLRAFTGTHERITPVRVRFDSGPGFGSAVNEAFVDWSFARPNAEVALDAAAAVAAIASGKPATVLAEGRGTRLVLRFEAEPERARAARLMALHCEE